MENKILYVFLATKDNIDKQIEKEVIKNKAKKESVDLLLRINAYFGNGTTFVLLFFGVFFLGELFKKSFSK